METSYQEAVSGVAVNKPMKPASLQDTENTEELDTQNHKHTPVQNTSPMAVPAYDRYIEDYYTQLQRLIVAPKNPVMRQPTQMRTLILPYGSRDGSVMYMARHVYWVHQQPQFIMGDYLKKPAEILESPMLHDNRN